MTIEIAEGIGPEVKVLGKAEPIRVEVGGTRRNIPLAEQNKATNFLGDEQTTITNPDEFYLDKVELLFDGGKLDLKGLMQEMSYYEDIFKPAITGEILLLDSVSLIEALKLNGSEYLNLVYKKSEKVSDAYAYSRKFRIFRAGPRKRTNLTTELYTLHFCSEELFVSEQKKVSRAYNGYTISEIVSDIYFENFVDGRDQRVDPPEILYTTPTVGVHDIIVPLKKPFEAINWLCQYAIADPQKLNKKEMVGADYVFFQNRYGFHFEPLEQLFLTDNTYRVLTYGALNTGNSTLGQKINTIKSYEFLDSFDTLYAIHKGIFANRVLSVDPIMRKTYTTDFNYAKEYPRLNTLNRNSIATQMENYSGKKVYEEYGSQVFTMVTNYNQTLAKYDKQTVSPGSVQKDFSVEKTTTYRTAQMASMTYSRIRAVISGDPGLTVGKVVVLALPSQYAAQEKIETIDKMNSARYLITAVRHIIDSSMRYESVIEMSKDSYSTQLPKYDRNVKTQ